MVLRYFAGKSRLAHRITKCIVAALKYNKGVTCYAEPFAGMFRVGTNICRTQHTLSDFHLNDNNADVYVFWKTLLSTKWLPDTTPLTARQYTEWKQSRKISAQRTFYGYQLSHRGTFFSGTVPGALHNKQRSLQGTRARAEDIKRFFQASNKRISVTDVDVLTTSSLKYKNTVVYCDPPYFGTTNNGWNRDSECAFWRRIEQWTLSELNNIVFVSSNRILPRTVGVLHTRQLFAIGISVNGHPQKCTDNSYHHMEYLYRVTRRERRQ